MVHPLKVLPIKGGGEKQTMEYELKDYPLGRGEFEERIKKAERCIFSLGLGDAAEEAGKINVTLFLARMHFLQEQLGEEPRAMFIGAPDFSFQTTPHKFQEAIPEGGKVVWSDGTYDFIPGEMEFDFCGMLVGEVKSNYGLEKVLDRLQEMEKKEYKVEGTRIELRNFSPGNHFLNVYEVEEHEKLDLPERVAILHTASDEQRDTLMKFVREKSQEMKTPFGRSAILLDKEAQEYVERCRYASSFSKRKRKLLFEEIFENDRIIANHNHYELTEANKGIIGCYTAEEGELFPITLDHGLPAYLVRGRRSLSEEKIGELGWEKTERWIYNELRKAQILPHGGGHKLISGERISRVFLYPERKVIAFGNKKGYEDLSNTPRSYRSEGILERVYSLGLAEPYARLSFIYGAKVL